MTEKIRPFKEEPQAFFETNGLVVWTERALRARHYAQSFLAASLKQILLESNWAWRMVEIETSILTPQSFISKEYDPNDYFWFEEGLALRPETTAGTYQYAIQMMKSDKCYKPPICFYQSGKSFRREQDKTLSHMRLKEFYQLEFQCIYDADSKNNYAQEIIPKFAFALQQLLPLPHIRTELSDRLPTYSECTTDLVSYLEGKSMELCSISLRKDFPSLDHRTFKVLEIAVGLDRCIHWMLK